MCLTKYCHLCDLHLNPTVNYLLNLMSRKNLDWTFCCPLLLCPLFLVLHFGLGEFSYFEMIRKTNKFDIINQARKYRSNYLAGIFKCLTQKYCTWWIFVTFYFKLTKDDFKTYNNCKSPFISLKLDLNVLY